MQGNVAQENLEFYEKELDSIGEIVRRNRHRSTEPFNWYGPDLEPRLPGRDCICEGCKARFR